MKHLSCILQVSTADMAGGAEGSALRLFHEYRRQGFPSYLAVGIKTSDDPDILLIPNDAQRRFWARFWTRTSDILLNTDGRNWFANKLKWLIYWVGQPKRILEIKRGHEDFNYPGAWKILELTPQRPDIVHFHNLHGNYFDLRALPSLSHRVPVILNLRDAWLLGGHCAHSFDCERWKTGCGECPDLSINPAIHRDATRFNWQRKRDIYKNSRYYVTAISEWLMDKAKQSILMDGAVDCRVIYNGIDMNVFNLGDKQKARKELNIPSNAKVILFAGNGVTRNIWKDYKTMHDAFVRLAGRNIGQILLFIAVGENAPKEVIGDAEIHFVAHQRDQGIMAKYHQAADVYIHASRAEAFGKTITEAMACGIPVVATAVGGIPEQIIDGETGFLVPQGDVEAMAMKIEQLLDNNDMRLKMGTQAIKHVRKYFSLDRQVNDFLNWYDEILDTHHRQHA